MGKLDEKKTKRENNIKEEPHLIENKPNQKQTKTNKTNKQNKTKQTKKKNQK